MSNFTKRAIKEAFLSLLDNQPLGSITVKEIVDTCGINRNTFYYHYEDLPTLLQEIIMEQADEIMNEFPSIDSVESCLRAVLEFSLKNRKIILNIYNSVNRNVYEHYLMYICQNVTANYIDRLAAGRKISSDDRALLVRLHKSCCYGIVVDWIQSGMGDEILANLHRLGQLMDGYIESILARCEAATQ